MKRIDREGDLPIKLRGFAQLSIKQVNVRPVIFDVTFGELKEFVKEYDLEMGVMFEPNTNEIFIVGVVMIDKHAFYKTNLSKEALSELRKHVDVKRDEWTPVLFFSSVTERQHRLFVEEIEEERKRKFIISSASIPQNNIPHPDYIKQVIETEENK